MKLDAKDFWRGIDKLAAKHGLTRAGLARRAGLDPTCFNKSKRTQPNGKPRWPGTESIALVLHATGETMTTFIGLMGKKAARP